MSDAHDSHGHEDHGHHAPTSFWTKYVFSTDHKVIGLQFTFASMIFVIVGGLLALGVRYELAWPQQDIPHAELLPHGWTTEAPEGNIARWSPGSRATLASPLVRVGSDDGGTWVTPAEAGSTHGITDVSQLPQLPKGTQAELQAFPSGIVLELPAGTFVRRDATTTTLAVPLTIAVPHGQLMSDYQYKRTLARLAPGTVGHVFSDGDVLDTRPIEVLGFTRTMLSGATETTRGQIAVPVRRDLTPIAITVPDQTLTQGEGEAATELEIEAAQITGLPATAIDIPKKILAGDSYNQLFTMHATVMIFFVIIPMLVGGFGNFLIPLMIGCRDMAFPKLNMLAFWLSVPAGFFILLSLWTGGGPAGGGWTMYPTLSENMAAFGGATNLGTTLWVAGVALVGFSSVVGAMNYITTIINMRAPGMTMFRMPLTVWSLFITSVLSLFATPMVTAAVVLLTFDRILGTTFFLPVTVEWVMNEAGQWESIKKTTGGQVLLWQHLFWFYSHPAVYIMILPAMGIASDVLSVFARKPIFGYKPMVFAICAIAGLGFIVWGHHMFQSGMNPVLGTTFMASTIMIAVPSAIKTFNWLGTLWGGNIRFTTPMLNALGFVSMFVIGGLSGIFMASAPVDIQIHDTYFIVAHIHYVLFGGSIFGIFAGIYMWFPKMFGRALNERWGVIHFILTLIAFNCTFFVMHILGIGGHPRRYASILEYPTLQHLQPLNVFMTISALCLGMAQIPFFYNVFASLPRKMSRAMVIVFTSVLVGPAVIGLTYWNYAATADQAGYGPLVGNVGFVGLLAGVLVVLVGMFRGLPTAGKVWTFCLGVPFVLYLCAVWSSTLSPATPLVEGRPPLHYEQTIMILHTAFLSPLTQDLMVAFGYGVLFAAAVSAVVFAVWTAGEMLRVGEVFKRLLYVVTLPGFLSPILLQQDTYMWLGMPGLFSAKWVLMGLAALPGLAYLLLKRPNDVFGAVVGDNPWEANSLEWATSSPPPHTNFHEIPTVHRGPYEYSSPVVDEDYLPQPHVLPAGVIEPSGH